jgi:N-acetylneuraminate synthase
MQFKIGDRPVGYDSPPYIIAEACNNFNGDINVAYELCDAAKEAGVDAIKFQMRLRPDRLDPVDHFVIRKYCQTIGLTWLCSAFSTEGFAIVEEAGVPAHKIPSGEATNDRLIEEVGKYKRPIIASTGMCTLMEVVHLENSLYMTHCPHAVLQCTSIYPTPYDKVRLNVLTSLLKTQPVIGLSDHTPTIWTAVGAVALGARIIEKHLTLNPHAEGPDHASSITPNQFVELIEGCHAVWEARGKHKEMFEEEDEKAKIHKFGIRP